MAKKGAAAVTDARIVVIGGGTGSFAVLNGLKHYARNITALVNMADDGGSTGQLRDELGVLPPGDIRQCLVALSNSSKVRDLFNYRFGAGLMEGHAFGNLFLTALEKMTGSFAEAVEVASEVLDITGRVEPITLSDVTLCMQTADGEVTKGQFKIGWAAFSQPRPHLWLEPEPVLNPAAVRAIREADLIVVSPGNLYASLAPALIVPGMREALAQSTARKAYVCNLVTKPGQTDGFEVQDFAAEIERFVGAPFLTDVIYNNHLPSKELVRKYAQDKEFAVKFDEQKLAGQHYAAYGDSLVAQQMWDGIQDTDPLLAQRSLIRHDPERTARILVDMSKT
jgi:uncharacterized cofD-like protein